MKRPHRTTAVLAGALAAGLLLGGCGAGGERSATDHREAAPLVPDGSRATGAPAPADGRGGGRGPPAAAARGPR
ncbi:hypothetical protein ACIP27_32535 [Streptomyces hydrogenans]|uniref:hypothetical protein n=1 Tax=Streptomyces hydrogenans TaxID=1873719 RepID=UPI0038133E67